VASWGDSKLAAHSLGTYFIHAAVPADFWSAVQESDARAQRHPPLIQFRPSSIGAAHRPTQTVPLPYA
jgi:hypothetical protein